MEWYSIWDTDTGVSHSPPIFFQRVQFSRKSANFTPPFLIFLQFNGHARRAAVDPVRQLAAFPGVLNFHTYLKTLLYMAFERNQSSHCRKKWAIKLRLRHTHSNDSIKYRKKCASQPLACISLSPTVGEICKCKNNTLIVSSNCPLWTTR